MVDKMGEKQGNKYSICIDDTLSDLLNEGAIVTDSKPSVFNKRALEVGAYVIINFPGLIEMLPAARKKVHQS